LSALAVATQRPSTLSSTWGVEARATVLPLLATPCELEKRERAMNAEQRPRVQDLPEVSALTSRLRDLLEEAALSQNALAARCAYDKSQISRAMRGERHPSWEGFVLPLVAAVTERRRRPFSETDLQALRILHEEAAVARARSGGEGLRTVRDGLAELRKKEADLQKRLSQIRKQMRVDLTKHRRSLMAALVITGLLASVLVLRLGNQTEATFFRGDRPDVVLKCYPGAPSVPCGIFQWRWSMPSSAKAAPIKVTLGVSFIWTMELDGYFSVDSACEATINWSFTAEVPDSAPAKLAAGIIATNDRTDLYAPIRRDTRQIDFTAQRIDSHSCTATLVWHYPAPVLGVKGRRTTIVGP
jgi:transcriptional regulator with XRE-family HTH domain